VGHPEGSPARLACSKRDCHHSQITLCCSRRCLAHVVARGSTRIARDPHVAIGDYTNVRDIIPEDNSAILGVEVSAGPVIDEAYPLQGEGKAKPAARRGSTR